MPQTALKKPPTKLRRFLAFIQDSDARDALIAFRKNEMSENDMAKITYPYLQRCLQSVWRKFPSLEGKSEVEDHVTALWLLYRRWMVENYLETEPFSPVVLRLAWRTLQEYARANLKTPLLQDDLEVAQCFNSDASSLEDRAFHEGEYESLDEDRIDASIAQQKINSILALSNNNAYPSASIVNKQEISMSAPIIVPGYTAPSPSVNSKKPSKDPAARRKPAAHALSKDQQELVDILKQLDWPQRTFADTLGITTYRLTSYLYGKTLSVPEQYMVIARETLRLELADGTGREKIERLNKKSMTEIIDEWAKILEIPYDNNKDLSIIFGVSVPTLTRWKNGIARPSVQSIIRIEKMVVDYRAAEKLRDLRIANQ